jgi:hypothetical protein
MSTLQNILRPLSVPPVIPILTAMRVKNSSTSPSPLTTVGEGASVANANAEVVPEEVESSGSSIFADHSDNSVETSRTSPLQSSLPSSWYTGEKFYALETRAIFAQVHSLMMIAANADCAEMAFHNPHLSFPKSRNLLQVQCRDVSHLSHSL